MRLPRVLVLAVTALALAGCGGTAPAAHPTERARLSGNVTSPSLPATMTHRHGSARATPTATPTPSAPLKGIVIALDPGHQLGNGRHISQIDKLVTAGTGGFRKACNTTGTATNGGFPEATLNWDVVGLLKKRLEHLGATVKLTRTSNSLKAWGPCIDTRGELAGKVHAALLLSIHGDGAPAGDHGYFTIAPTRTRMFHPAVQARSLTLAKDLDAKMAAHGFTRSNYIGGGSGYYTRDDLGTLNLSSVPVAMIELGNMRNAGDAAVMTSAAGRQKYVWGLASGIRMFLGK